MGDDPWKHRSDGMRCKSCMWFAPKVSSQTMPAPSDADVERAFKRVLKGQLSRQDFKTLVSPPPVYDLGRCRRHAPTMSGYPAVFVNDWCGDHKLNEEWYAMKARS